MRICDICFREITDVGGYEIKDGVRKDNCGECLDRIMTEYAGRDDKLVEEYIKLMEEKSDNAEKVILKIKEISGCKNIDILMREKDT